MTESSVSIASSAQDAGAVSALEGFHAELTGGLAVRVQALVSAAGGPAASRCRSDLVEWIGGSLIAYTRAEARTLYVAARSQSNLVPLVEGLVSEHRMLEELASELRLAASTDAAVGTARALQVLVETHLRKEDELLVPALAGAPGVTLAEMVEDLRIELGEPAPAAGAAEAPSAAAHSCTCGEHDAAGYPELDARAVPHAIRHATIFGALDGVAPGGGMVLVAPHDPLPLLAQIEQRSPATFAVSYLERGPEAWRLQFVRRG